MTPKNQAKSGQPSTGIGDKLARLADKIAESALAEDVTFDARLDAFKCLTSYWVSVQKTKRNPEEDSGGENSMEAIKRKLAASS